MSIIVEGPDGAGKTTLVHKLLNHHPSLELHPKFVGSDFEGRDDMLARVVEDVTLSGPFDLYDRHPFISEYIMSTALSRPLSNGFGYGTVRPIRHDFLKKSLVILCLPPFAKVLDKVTGPESTDQPKEVMWGITGIYAGYQMFKMLHAFPENLYVHDYTNPISEGLLHQVVSQYVKEHN